MSVLAIQTRTRLEISTAGNSHLDTYFRLVELRFKKQGCVALSTAEAEYVVLCSAAQELVWLERPQSYEVRLKQLQTSTRIINLQSP